VPGRHCEARNGETAPGKGRGRLIANLTVRDTPGTPCRAELVVRGITELRKLISAKGMGTVAIPEIGNSGSLDRETILRVIARHLDLPHLR
jgi:hypothetical protein